MVVPEDKQEEDIYWGDSGAWIIRDSDNALVGLLWGWINGQLIFTPIKDVFEDIKETFNATEVGLPKLPTGSDPGVLPGVLPGGAAAAQAIQACRVKNQDLQKSRSSFKIPIRPAITVPNSQPPIADPISISQLIEANEVTTEIVDSESFAMDTTKDGPPSPTPSLSSSVSSSPKIVSRCPSAVKLQSQSDCVLGEPAVIIREDSDAEGNSKMEEQQSYSPLQRLPKQKLGKSGQEIRLTLGFILENMGLAERCPSP